MHAAFQATYGPALERQKFLDDCLATKLSKLTPERQEITMWHLNEGLLPPNWAAIDTIQKHHNDAVSTIGKKAGFGGLTGGSGGKAAWGTSGAVLRSLFGVFQYTIKSFDSAFHQAKKTRPVYTPQGWVEDQCPS